MVAMESKTQVMGKEKGPRHNNDFGDAYICCHQNSCRFNQGRLTEVDASSTQRKRQLMIVLCCHNHDENDSSCLNCVAEPILCRCCRGYIAYVLQQ